MIYGSKHGKYLFSSIVYSNLTTTVSNEIKLQFLSSLEVPWNIFNHIHWIISRNLLYFFWENTRNPQKKSPEGQYLLKETRKNNNVKNNWARYTLSLISRFLHAHWAPVTVELATISKKLVGTPIQFLQISSFLLMK